MVTRRRVRRSPFRFYDVRVGDTGTVIEVRYQGHDIEAWLMHIDRTGEEHWFRAHELEKTDDCGEC